MRETIKHSVYLSIGTIILLCSLILFPSCNQKPKAQEVVLLITIDTLRKDHLGCYGYSRNTSPFIDRLARKGIVFDHTITPLPLTDASHASILTSLHPLVHGVLLNSTPLTKKVETLSEVWKQKGYFTIGAVAVRHLSGNYQFSQGFDSFSDQCDVPNKRGLKWTRLANTVNQSLFKQIKGYRKHHSDKPLFMWVHYYDPHAPYLNWEHIAFDTPSSSQSPHIENYDKEIRYTDDAVKALFDFLEKNGLTQKLTVCITADHGEQLGEHGTDGGHNDFYSETVFVPLIFQGYGIAKQKRLSRYVSTMDIAPTLLHLKGFEFTEPVHGRTLLDSNGNPLKTKHDNRGYMVIGHPNLVRSLQWIRQPYSFIMNFDYMHKNWYVSSNSQLPDEMLTKALKNDMHLQYYEKSDKYSIGLDFPFRNRRGLYRGVFRFDIKENTGATLFYRIGSRRKSAYPFEKNHTGTITAFFPVTPLDRLTTDIFFKTGTKLENFRWGIFPAHEVEQYLEPSIKPQNAIFKQMGTERRYTPYDELYHLGEDFPMTANLLEAMKNHRTPPQVIDAKKQLYKRLELYRIENKSLFGKKKRIKPLTEKEKEMLKSLGYL